MFAKWREDSSPDLNLRFHVGLLRAGLLGFCYEKCERNNSHKKFESASHKSANDTWLKSLVANLPWQLGPTEGLERDDCVSVSKINRQNYPYLSCADSSVIQKPQVVLNEKYFVKLPLVLKKLVAGLPSPSHQLNIPGKLQTILPHLCQKKQHSNWRGSSIKKISPLVASGEWYKYPNSTNDISQPLVSSWNRENCCFHCNSTQNISIHVPLITRSSCP